MLIFLDTETTGIENGRLVQLAYKAGDNFVNEFFKPAEPITIEAMSIHHITNEMVADKPILTDEKKEELSQLFENNIIVAHNAKYDIDVLNREGIRTGKYICTLKVAQNLYDLPQYKLQYLRYWMGLVIDDVVAHDALSDIIVLEKVFDRCKTVDGGDMPEEKMIEISSMPVLLRKMSFGKYKGQAVEEVAKNDVGYLQWLRRQDDLDEDLIHTLDYYLKK